MHAASIFIPLIVSCTSLDTVDFWHIYYNSKLVYQGNELMRKVSGLKPIEFDSIAVSDTFFVSYFSDTPKQTPAGYVDAGDEKDRLVGRFTIKNKNGQIIILAKFIYDHYKRNKASKKTFSF